MKKLKLLIISVVFNGCVETTPNVILWKSYRTFMDHPMQTGICRFGISGKYADQTRQTQDSCHFYHVTDTIK